jgi:hypothetical protein
MQEIKLYLFILSIIFLLKYVVDFGLKLMSNNTEPVMLSKIEGTFLYLATSYVITYCLI